MYDKNIVRSMQLPPIKLQKYDRYLPTAFDESLSLLEKINKVILYLQDYGNVTEEMLEKWNEVYRWVRNEGVNEAALSIIRELITDGTIADIINIELFNKKADQSDLDIVTAQVANTDKWKKRSHYDVVEFGAIGDNMTDNSSVLQELSDQLEDGDTLFFPKGDFLTTEPVHIKRAIKLVMNGFIIADHGGVGVLVKNTEIYGNFSGDEIRRKNKLDLDINIDRVTGKGYELLQTCTGVEVWNAFFSQFNFKVVRGNYEGVKYIASKIGTGYAATSYCNATIGLIRSVNKNIILEARDTGWVSQNQFYSGSMTTYNIAGVEPSHINLVNTGTSIINENTFYSVSLEGLATTAIRCVRASNNKFTSCRYEMPKLKFLFDFSNSSRFNKIIDGHGVANSMRQGLYMDNAEVTSNTLVTFIDYLSGYVTYYDRMFYIKPNNFRITDTLIPEMWDNVVFENPNLEMAFSGSNPKLISGETLLVDLTYGSILDISNYSKEITSVQLNAPPRVNKEIYLFSDFFGISSNSFVLLAGNGIDNIIDKTDLPDKTIKNGYSITRLLYKADTKTIYIMEKVKG